MIYIWLRATTEWDNEAVFNAQIPAGFEQKVTLWNRTFNIPYHVFRHRVRQIARLNHARIEGVEFACWEDIPEGALVVPVDDDDWFAPSVGKVLENAYSAEISGYFWPGSFLEVPIDWRHEIGKPLRALLPFVGPKFLCTTNSYAMVKTQWAKTLLSRHVQASAWFKANRKTSVKRIDQRMSIMNRTLASRTSLSYKRPPFTQGKLALSFMRYRRVYLKPVPAELEWSKPYQVMMSELMAELQPRSAKSE